jgi:hypothetical protein
MRQTRGFSLGALAIAATAMFAAVAPSSATAAARQHKATHFVARHAHIAHYGYRGYGAYRSDPADAYGAIPAPGGSGFASPSYPGYGYGYGDNSTATSF